MIAHFAYRTFEVPLEVADVNAEAPELRIRCPLCNRRCRINPDVHHVIVDHAPRKVVSIHPVLECPGCDWRVIVVKGTAYDVAGPRAFKPKDPVVIVCENCGDEFNPGAAVNQKKCRSCLKPWNAGKTAERGRYWKGRR